MMETAHPLDAHLLDCAHLCSASPLPPTGRKPNCQTLGTTTTKSATYRTRRAVSPVQLRQTNAVTSQILSSTRHDLPAATFSEPNQDSQLDPTKKARANTALTRQIPTLIQTPDTTHSDPAGASPRRYPIQRSNTPVLSPRSLLRRRHLSNPAKSWIPTYDGSTIYLGVAAAHLTARTQLRYALENTPLISLSS